MLTSFFLWLCDEWDAVAPLAFAFIEKYGSQVLGRRSLRNSAGRVRGSKNGTLANIVNKYV